VSALGSRLTIARIETQPRGNRLELTVFNDTGVSSVVVVPAHAGLSTAIDDYRPTWIDADALAFDRRWMQAGGRFASLTQRMAFSALEFATAMLAARVLGLTPAALFGAVDVSAPAPAPDLDAASAIDYDRLADPQALAIACLETNAVAIRFTLPLVGGPQGLRRVLALARAFNLTPIAVPSDAEERELAIALAAAFGFSIDDRAVALAPQVTRVARSHPGTTIKRVRLRRVKVPLREVYVSAMYLTDHVLRTIIEIQTADGVIGLGETLGGEDVFRLLATIAKGWIGASPFDRRALSGRYARIIYENRNGRNGWQALAGLDVACHDLIGKTLDLPLAAWLGGTGTSMRVVRLLPTAILDRVVPREELRSVFANIRNTERVAVFAKQLHQEQGITCFKYKSSGIGLAWDVAAIRALREALGSAVEIRFDPNAAYDSATALAICRALEPYALCWYEDPTDGIEGLARLRARLTQPIATNMAVVQFDHLAPAMRQRAIDVVLGDTLHWGGVEGLRDLAAACDAMGISLANHAFYECGVAAAVNLQVAIGLGLTRHAHDQAHDGLVSDLLMGDPLAIRNGHLSLPSGAGLGVALDAAKVREFQTDELEIR
jgi:glucarate dehydratase